MGWSRCSAVELAVAAAAKTRARRSRLSGWRGPRDPRQQRCPSPSRGPSSYGLRREFDVRKCVEAFPCAVNEHTFSRSVGGEELPHLAERDFSQVSLQGMSCFRDGQRLRSISRASGGTHLPALVPLCLIMHPQSSPNALFDLDLPARRRAPVGTGRVRDRRSGAGQVGLGGMGRAGRAGEEAEEGEWGRQGKHFALDEVVCGGGLCSVHERAGSRSGGVQSGPAAVTKSTARNTACQFRGRVSRSYNGGAHP